MGRVKQAFRDYRAILAAQLFALIASAMYLPVIARVLGPEGFGHLSIVLVTGQILAAFAFLWSSTGTLPFAQEEFHVSGALGTTVIARTLVGLAGLGLLMALCWLSPWPLLLGVSTALWRWLPVVLLAWLAADTMQYVLRAAGKLKAFAVVSYGRNLTLLLAGVLFAFGWLPRQPTVAFAVEGLAFLAMTLWALWYLPRTVWRVSSSVPRAIRMLATTAGPLLGLQLSGYLVNGVDLYFINQSLGHEAVGQYQVAYRMMQLIANGAMGIMPVLFYVLMALKLEVKDEATQRYVARVIPQVAVGWAVLMVLVVLFVEMTFALVFSSTYAQSLNVFRILAVGLTAQLVLILYSDLLMVHGRLWPMCAVHVAGLAVNVLGDWWFVPRLGLLGAAWSVAARLACMAVGYWLIGCRIADQRSARVFVPLGVAGLTCVGIGLWPSALGPWAVGLVGLVGVVGVSRRLGIFTPADWPIVEALNLPAPWKQTLQMLYSVRPCRSV